MIDAPTPGHAEVEDHRIVPVGMDQPVLGSSTESSHSGARQPLPEILGKGSPQIRPPSLHARDPAAEQHLFKAFDGGFDFGELRHPDDMANVGSGS
jgi:hypothetical protein